MINGGKRVENDVWEDIGTRKRPEPEELPKIETKLNGHEPVERTEFRKKTNIEAIDKLQPICDGFHVKSSSCIRVKVLNRYVEFWPSVDLWYSESKNKYGTGIPKMVEIILKKHQESLSEDRV